MKFWNGLSKGGFALKPKAAGLSKLIKQAYPSL